MRLVDLDPEWWQDVPTRRGQGIAFRCPHCTKRIAVAFSVPLDGGSPSVHAKGVTHGRRGMMFDTLYIYPTIFVPGHARIRIDNGDVDWTPA